MIKVLSKLPKGASAPKTTNKHDGFVLVSDVKENKDNGKIFNYEDIEDLGYRIDKFGLMEVPEIYQDGELSSGHRRRRAFISQGYDYMPVQVVTKEDDPLKRIDRLREKNMYRTLTFGQKYRGLEENLSLWLKLNDSLIGTDEHSNIIDELCKDWQVSKVHYGYMTELKQSGDDSWNKMYELIRDDKEGVVNGYKKVTKEIPQMRTAIEIPSNFLSQQDISHLLNTIKRTINGMKSGEWGSIGNGISFNPLSTCDETLYSTAAHGAICKYLEVRLKNDSEYSDDWVQTFKNDERHDVVSEDDDTGIEVKTRLVKNGGTNPSFEPNNFKEGYHFLLAQTEDLDEVWIGFGKLTKDDVKPIQNGKSKVINDKLIDNKNFHTIKGLLKKDKNGKVQFKYDLNKWARQ